MSKRKNKKSAGKALFFIISFFFAFKVFGSDMSAKELFEKAGLEFDNHDFPAADSSISKAIAIDENNAQYYLLRAKIEVHYGSPSEIARDLENAERCDPQFYQIYDFKAELLKHAFNRARQYYLTLNKAQLFKRLQDNNIKLPKKFFGMLTSEFNAVSGSGGYMEADLNLAFKEIPLKEVPFVGKTVKQIFRNIDANSKEVILLKELPPGDYEITAYRLETCFLDPSEKFYRFIYWVRYRPK